MSLTAMYDIAYPVVTDTLANLANGSLFQYKANGPVWVRGAYDRASKKYSVTKYEDMNHESFKSGSTVVIINGTI